MPIIGHTLPEKCRFHVEHYRQCARVISKEKAMPNPVCFYCSQPLPASKIWLIMGPVRLYYCSAACMENHVAEAMSEAKRHNWDKLPEAEAQREL
jgi:hypothetical protein